MKVRNKKINNENKLKMLIIKAKESSKMQQEIKMLKNCKN